MNFGKILEDSKEIYRKFFKNLIIWVSLRVVVLLKCEVWVWAVLTLCHYGTRTDTVSVSVYTIQRYSIDDKICRKHNILFFWSQNWKLYLTTSLNFQVFSCHFLTVVVYAFEKGHTHHEKKTGEISFQSPAWHDRMTRNGHFQTIFAVPLMSSHGHTASSKGSKTTN